MTLKRDAKFQEKLTCGLEHDKEVISSAEIPNI